MYINPTDMLAYDLSTTECQDLIVEMQRLVLNGEVDMNSPFFRAWITATEYDGRQTLLLYSTAYPQRMLLSVSLHLYGLLYSQAKLANEVIDEVLAEEKSGNHDS